MSQAWIVIITNTATAFIFTIIGVWGTMVALDLGIVRRKLTEGDSMTEIVDTPKKSRWRKLRLYDYVLIILLVGMLVSGIGTWSAQSRAADSDRKAASAARESAIAAKKVADQNKCLENFSNKLADALDRRTADNKLLEDADSLKDKAFDSLIANILKQPPPSDATFRRLLTNLQKASQAKAEAKSQLDTGRVDKSYPDPPREVCK